MHKQKKNFGIYRLSEKYCNILDSFDINLDIFLMERVINTIRSPNLLQYLHSFLSDESNISFHFDKAVEGETVKFSIATHNL